MWLGYGNPGPMQQKRICPSKTNLSRICTKSSSAMTWPKRASGRCGIHVFVGCFLNFGEQRVRLPTDSKGVMEPGSPNPIQDPETARATREAPTPATGACPHSQRVVARLD